MSILAERIAEIRSEYLERAAAAWRGRERQLLLELVRGLDEAAFAFTMAPNREQLKRRDEVRHYILRGAASALRPVLESVRDDPGGVPWGPTSSELSAIADRHLANCGRLAAVQRVAMLERYGLAKTTFSGGDRALIEVVSDAEDTAERKAAAWLTESVRARFSAEERELAAQKTDIARQIDRYVGVEKGWFIRYDSDERLVAYHRRTAAIYAAGIAEGDALPGDALIGARPFAAWNDASIDAYGRLLHHIAFATRLKKTHPSLELRNLLTVFARKDDALAVLEQLGEPREWCGRVMAGLMLDGEAAAACERDFEMPLPYYIDFGRDFVLLPMFGGLMNACAGLVWHLRKTYRRDWDRAVDGRERLFRDDLRALFSPDRYFVSDRGFPLRRSDGSELTDIDAAIVDRDTKTVALVQLKWHDIYGHSLSERNSRRINLLKAEQWVDRVSGWVNGRTAGEIADVLGLPAGGTRPPILLVIARHAAQFAGDTKYDSRATWISWPRVVQAHRASPRADILVLLKKARTTRQARHKRASPSEIHLPGLTVEIRTQ